MKTKHGFATATMNDLREEIARLRKEVAGNHERLAAGVASEDQKIRDDLQAALDEFGQQYGETIENFRKGTRDFGSTIDSRFNNVIRRHNELAALVESRTVRGRWRRLRVAVAALVYRVRAAMGGDDD